MHLVPSLPTLIYTALLLLSSTAQGRVPRQQLPRQTSPQASNNVTFGPCPATGGPFSAVNSTVLEQLQCANISVPVSHSAPAGSGETIQLALVRLPAADPQRRVGNLFVNPGGPGSPASTMVARLASGALPLGGALRSAFDLVAMDPRGVGLSSPLRCDVAIGNEPTAGLDPAAVDGLAKLTDYNRRLGESCRALSGSALVDNMDTVAVARDMELVRVAMGGEEMNFLGQSYGTQLGAQYAQLFPDKVRSMVLDGVIQHTGGYTSNALVQTTAVDRAMQQYFTTCELNATLPTCGGVGSQLRQTWASLVDTARTSGLTAPGCDGTRCSPNVTLSDMLGTFRALIESPGGQARFARTLQLAAQGNATFANALASGVLTGDAFADSSSLGGINVQCADGHFVDALKFNDQGGAGGLDASAAAARVRMMADLSRTFTTTPGMDQFYRRVVVCSGWPVGITNPRTAQAVQGLKTPALLVHTRFDPAASPAYAVGMVEEFRGVGARLLVREGLGHTSYFNNGDAARAMERYLVGLEVPGEGTVVSS